MWPTKWFNLSNITTYFFLHFLSRKKSENLYSERSYLCIISSASSQHISGMSHGVQVQHLSSQRIHKSGSLFLKTKSANCALPKAPTDSPSKYKQQQQLNKSACCVSVFSNVEYDALHNKYLPLIYTFILSFLDRIGVWEVRWYNTHYSVAQASCRSCLIAKIVSPCACFGRWSGVEELEVFGLMCSRLNTTPLASCDKA